VRIPSAHQTDTRKAEAGGRGHGIATDMLIKARHAGLRIAEVPITYYPRAEGAQSKLKSLRDSWRHVEYILTYTPKHYLYPGLALLIAGIALMAIALLNAKTGYSPGIHTSIIGGMAIIIGYNLLFLGVITDLILANRLGFQPHPVTMRFIKLTPPRSIAIGILMISIGLIMLGYTVLQWVESGYRRVPLSRENILALTIISLGLEAITQSFISRILRIDILSLKTEKGHEITLR